MKPTTPHDSLDNLIAAALHGELTPEERAAFDSRLQADAAARAAYQEAQAMHDLLEKTHTAAQPDPAFEQRMVSAVRRKLKTEQHRETSWESLLALWMGLKRFFAQRRVWEYVTVIFIIVILSGVALGPITNGTRQAKANAAMQMGHQIAMAEYQAQVDAGVPNPVEKGVRATPDGKVFEVGETGNDEVDITDKVRDFARTGVLPATLNDLAAQRSQSASAGATLRSGSGIVTLNGANSYNGATTVNSGALVVHSTPRLAGGVYQGGTVVSGGRLTAGSIGNNVSLGATSAPASSGAIGGILFGTGVVSTLTGGVTSRDTSSYHFSYGATSGDSAVKRPSDLTVNGGTLQYSISNNLPQAKQSGTYNEPAVTTTPQGGTIKGKGFVPPGSDAIPTVVTKSGEQSVVEAVRTFPAAEPSVPARPAPALAADNTALGEPIAVAGTPFYLSKDGKKKLTAEEKAKELGIMPDQIAAVPSALAPEAPALVDARKLIRNAQLDLQVKSFQDAMDQITALTKAAGGYVDTSNSQKGGNGKLQGTVVVKVLPQNLDAYLLRLRDLGQVQNQSVSTDDVTKDYFDTQARLVNSQKMEAQLQELLKRENGKVSDLLQVERELARVRGDIEGMQGQLKLYDFQVQYATITINLREKDLNQAAAYLLKEQDEFSLFATDVEGTFQKARKIADDFKAQVLVANLVHNSPTDMAAAIDVMVAPDQIEPFLAEVRGLGRVANFTRQTQRVAKDGGDSSQPADETLTDKDKVQVQISIRYDNTTAAYLLKEQDDFSLFAIDVENAFQQARRAAEDFKAQVLQANLVHNSGSDVAADLVVMVAPDQIEPFLAQVRTLGRVANFTRQTQRITKDGSTPEQTGANATTEKDKVQVHVAIRSDDETRKQVALTIVAKAVDVALDQAKAAALANAGVEILSSSLNKAADGQSTAALSVRVPGKEYDAVMTAFKAIGRTASLSIQRNDDSGPGANGDDAPVIVALGLTDDDAPVQLTQLVVLASDVDTDEQQIKKDAAASGVEVKASSFQRQPDGTELAQMTFRLPMGKYAAFVETVKALGKIESQTVQRNDRPDQTVADDTAPVEIGLQLHNERDLVPDNTGFFATLRNTFGEGAGALFSSVRVIGVIIALLLPWLMTGALLAWVGRRIYVWRKAK